MHQLLFYVMAFWEKSILWKINKPSYKLICNKLYAGQLSKWNYW